MKEEMIPEDVFAYLFSAFTDLCYACKDDTQILPLLLKWTIFIVALSNNKNDTRDCDIIA